MNMDDSGESLGKLDYLRGPHGQLDRNTLWRGGLGTLPGTGEGGMMVDFEPKKPYSKNVATKSERRQECLAPTAVLTDHVSAVGSFTNDTRITSRRK